MRGQITETTDPEKPDSHSGRRRKLKFGAKERSNCLPGRDFILSYIDHISYIYMTVILEQFYLFPYTLENMLQPNFEFFQ